MAPTIGLLRCTTCSAEFDTERLLKRHLFFRHREKNTGGLDMGRTPVLLVHQPACNRSVGRVSDSTADVVAVSGPSAMPPPPTLAEIRQSILLELRQRASDLRMALHANDVTPAKMSGRRVVFPPPVPRYRPPRPAPEEVRRVRKVLFPD